MIFRYLKQGLLSALVISLAIPLYSPDSQDKETQGIETVTSTAPRILSPTPAQFRRLSSFLAGPELPDRVSDEIEQLLRIQNFNGTVALARRGEVLYRGCFGLADFAARRAMEIDAQFQLASVSKQFTAMAVMMLAERHTLDYDEPYTNYIPEFPYPAVTVRQLLNHTAGMPNYMYLMERHWEEETLPDNEDMLRMLVKHRPGLYFTPGRRFDYSNTGYALLALLVERLSGRTFGQFLEEEIFVPLGMWDSYLYSPSRNRRGERQVRGHHRYRRRWTATAETLHEEVYGDKGIYSTVEDMLKWDRALYRCSLVSPETLQQAFQPLTLRNGRQWQYGFGFRIEDHPEEKVVFHFGRWNSFSTCIFRDLGTDYTLIMLSNVKRNLDPLQRKIRALLPGEEERLDPWLNLMGRIDPLWLSLILSVV